MRHAVRARSAPGLGKSAPYQPRLLRPATDLWLVSRYADVRQILLDPVTYLPDNAQHAVAPLSGPALRTLARAGSKLPPALANNGGAHHAGLRRVVMRFFNAERVAAAAPLLENTAREMLTGLRSRYATGDQCDLASEYARYLPCRVMMQLLSVAHVPATTLVEWSDAALELFYGWPSAERQAHLAELVADFHRWLTDQVAGAAPADGLIGALRNHRLLAASCSTPRPPWPSVSSSSSLASPPPAS